MGIRTYGQIGEDTCFEWMYKIIIAIGQAYVKWIEMERAMVKCHEVSHHGTLLWLLAKWFLLQGVCQGVCPDR